MGIMAKDSGGDFEPLAAGTYVARCVSVVDIGVHETGFGPKEKVYIGFEIPSERIIVKNEQGQEEDKGPAFIGSRYTLSISDKSILGQHLTGWRGKPFTEEERQGFDITNVLGAPCLINVIHSHKNNKTYANIQAIMRLTKGMECPAAETELVAYSPNDNALAANFEKLHEWQQKLVREGYKMAEGSTIVGSALAAQQQAGGPVATNQPPPVEQQLTPPASQHPPMTAAEAMAAAQQAAQTDDHFDDDIPF